MVNLGKLGTSLRNGAVWTDEYPAWPSFAKELEELLEFARSAGQLERYQERLRGRNRERDSALMELRVARHLKNCKFELNEWEPQGAENYEGEYFAEGPDKHRVFVEVKSPDWQGELLSEQQNATRMSKGKHIKGEGHWVAPWERLRFAVDKAYKKFRDDTPNLLIVADNLFVGLEMNTEQEVGRALYSRQDGYFMQERNERLGGLGVFWYDKFTVSYHMRLFGNPDSLPATRLPSDMLKALSAEILVLLPVVGSADLIPNSAVLFSGRMETRK